VGDYSERRRFSRLAPGKDGLALTPPHCGGRGAWIGVSAPRGVQARRARPSRHFQRPSRRRLRAANRGFRVAEVRKGERRRRHRRGELLDGDGCLLLRCGADGASDGEERHGGDGGLGEEGGAGGTRGEGVG